MAAWQEVVVQNCYRLAEDLDGAVVVDVGAHIGSFTCTVLDRGASHVTAIEPDPRNFKQLGWNVKKHSRGHLVDLIEAAACQSTLCQSTLYKPRFHSFPDRGGVNTGGGSLSHIPGAIVIVVPGIDIGLLMRRFRSLDLLKLDCEGAEQSILKESRPWINKVGTIVGEMHPDLWYSDFDCQKFLREHFEVEEFPGPDPKHPLFCATKKPQPLAAG